MRIPFLWGGRWIPPACIFLFAAGVVFLPGDYFKRDMAYWYSWIVYMREHGFAEIYRSGSDYHPFFLYFIYLFSLVEPLFGGKLQESVLYIRVIPFFFDFLTIILLYFSLPECRKYLPFLLFNFGFFYNSLVWGQVDSMLVFFGLSSLLAARKYPVAAAVLYLITLNLKLQGLFLLPVFLAAMAVARPTLKQSGLIFLLCPLVQTLLVLPFVLVGDGGLIIKVLTSAIGRWPYVTVGANNVWSLFLGYSSSGIVDTEPFLFADYRTVGTLMFLGFSAIVLSPLLVLTLRKLARGGEFDKDFLGLLCLSAALAYFGFYFFNTQMHERYIHPAMSCLFVYAALSRSRVAFSALLLLSLAYFSNLDSYVMLIYFDWKFRIFNAYTISYAYSLLGLTLLFLLFRETRRSLKKQEINIVAPDPVRINPAL